MVNFMTVLVFDIETVPDVQGGRKLYALQNLTDEEAANAMFLIRKEKTGTEFLAHHLQRIVTISAVLSDEKLIKVWSLGDEGANEKEIITHFFAELNQYTPTLVSWNGTGFDLPVLHYRALYHGIAAPTYWDTGEITSGFKWNNYLNRYHYQHLDLMDILASYQSKAYVPLDEMATLLGFPGKIGMDGKGVWETFKKNNIRKIQRYCEVDVLNTYCIYLRFELIRGRLSEKQYADELNRLGDYLKAHNQIHFDEFLKRWKN